MLIVRFLLGSIALTAVWFATWPLESGRLDPMALAIVFSVAVSALASWLSLSLLILGVLRARRCDPIGVQRCASISKDCR
jgi:hypothetical protein